MVQPFQKVPISMLTLPSRLSRMQPLTPARTLKVISIHSKLSILTSNKTYVKLNDDEDDFDKSGLIVYGLRRDGLASESDSWAEYDGNVYSRNDKDLEFRKMAQTVADNPEFGTVWDTPVPINLLDFSNENYANIDYELVRDGTAEDVRLVNLIYTDKHTEGKPDTDVLPYTGGIIPMAQSPGREYHGVLLHPCRSLRRATTCT